MNNIDLDFSSIYSNSVQTLSLYDVFSKSEIINVLKGIHSDKSESEFRTEIHNFGGDELLNYYDIQNKMKLI